jgi:hypothetical protein
MDFNESMTQKTDEELLEYLSNIDRYSPEALAASASMVSLILSPTLREMVESSLPSSHSEKSAFKLLEISDSIAFFIKSAKPLLSTKSIPPKKPQMQMNLAYVNVSKGIFLNDRLTLFSHMLPLMLSAKRPKVFTGP